MVREIVALEDLRVYVESSVRVGSKVRWSAGLGDEQRGAVALREIFGSRKLLVMSSLPGCKCGELRGRRAPGR